MSTQSDCHRLGSATGVIRRLRRAPPDLDLFWQAYGVAQNCINEIAGRMHVVMAQRLCIMGRIVSDRADFMCPVADCRWQIVRANQGLNAREQCTRDLRELQFKGRFESPPIHHASCVRVATCESALGLKKSVLSRCMQVSRYTRFERLRPCIDNCVIERINVIRIIYKLFSVLFLFFMRCAFSSDHCRANWSATSRTHCSNCKNAVAIAVRLIDFVLLDGPYFLAYNSKRTFTKIAVWAGYRNYRHV